MTHGIAIVGASLAGGTAAATLRDAGYEGEIVLIGEEDRPPYERPPLSKEYLRGDQPFEQALVRSDEFWTGADIDLRLGVRAESLDLGARRVRLSDGGDVAFDRLLIATGGHNRTLRVPGAELDGVFDLRTAADADRIREAAKLASHAVVVGMGFIGAEVAASLRQMGLAVTVVEIFSTALERALGHEVGRGVELVHRDHGVVMRFQDGVDAFEGGDRLERVRTRRGDAIETDLAVVGVGIVPADGLAAEAGIEVFAAGDVARHAHPLAGGHVRVEHWQNALKQGEAAARSVLGAGAPYADVHWFWSDQFDTQIQYAGFHGDHDEVVFRGDPDSRSFAAFYLREGRLVGAASLGWARDVRRAQKLIAAGVSPDRGSLRDPGTDLRTLAP